MTARRDALEELRELARDRRSLEQLRSAPHDDPEDARCRIQPLCSAVLSAVEREAQARRDITEARRALTHSARVLKQARDHSDYALIRTAESVLGAEVTL